MDAEYRKNTDGNGKITEETSPQFTYSPHGKSPSQKTSRRFIQNVKTK